MACSSDPDHVKKLEFGLEQGGLEEGEVLDVEVGKDEELKQGEESSLMDLLSQGGFFQSEKTEMASHENERLLNLEAKVSKIEAFLGMKEPRDHNSWIRSRGISKETMLHSIIEAIKTNRNNYGVSKHFIKKYVSDLLGINVGGSQHYTKKLNVMLQFGIQQGHFVFSAADQLFRIK